MRIYETPDERAYDVTFVSDWFTMKVTVTVPDYKDDDDHAYSDDPSAIDEAVKLITDQYAFDPLAYSYDVAVEPAF